MTETIKQGMPVSVRKVALMIAGISLAAMVAYSVGYRMEHPSLTKHNNDHPGHAEHASDMGDNPMAMVGALMQKLQENPGDIDLMSTLGRSFMSMQSWERALTFWDMILEVEAENTLALNQKGVCLFRLKRFKEAAEPLERILVIDKEDLHARFNLGILYKHYLDNPDQAKAYFQAVLDAKPDDKTLLEGARKELGK